MTNQEKVWFERGFAAYAENIPRHQLYILTPKIDAGIALKWIERGWTASKEDNDLLRSIEARRVEPSIKAQ